MLNIFVSIESAYDLVSKSPVKNFTCAGRMPTIERDSNIINLEKTIYSQIKSAIPQEEIIVPQNPPQQISFVSVEDAMRDLQNMKDRE